MRPQTKPRTDNLYIAGYSEACSQMADRIEKFPNDTHFVSFNGDEYEITPKKVPAFVRFLREQARQNATNGSNE
jgi:hypothetical protein